MSGEPKQELLSVPPCTLPINDPSLKPEGLGKHQGNVRVACHACGVQYDRREVEGFAPACDPRSRFVCPKGHLAQDRRVWERPLTEGYAVNEEERKAFCFDRSFSREGNSGLLKRRAFLLVPRLMISSKNGRRFDREWRSGRRQPA